MVAQALVAIVEGDSALTGVSAPSGVDLSGPSDGAFVQGAVAATPIKSSSNVIVSTQYTNLAFHTSCHSFSCNICFQLFLNLVGYIICSGC
jgi:hypothetical protein